MTQPADTAADRAEEEPRLPPPSRRYRVINAMGWTLVWLGALTLGFVAHQLWITTFFARQNQAELAADLEEHFEAAEITEIPYVPIVPPGESLPPDDPSIVSGALSEPGVLRSEAPPEDGKAFAEIRIPSLAGLADGWAIVEGVSLQDLKNGAGHMPWTPLPGQPGNSVISGHRTTYGQPFHDLDLLNLGDLIEVETALGTHIYAVREIHIVKPTDVWVTDPRAGAWLTLTTCNPKFSARERLVIAAQLIEGPNAEVILGRL